ncbi:MAG: GntR family transcriptional regulator [Burkholderiales bacterium]|nr:GntR family transcriptional regulator [Burkholderiales bacterium]
MAEITRLPLKPLKPPKRRKDMQDGAGESRVERIRCELTREILAGRLAPGSRISEEVFSRQFGVSRTPIREALKHLSSEGLVELRPRQGAIVAQLTVSALVEMFELMALLEADCAALAARRCTIEDRHAITSAHEACKRAAKCKDPRQFYRANEKFHECIYRTAHNRMLEDQVIALRNRLEPYRREVTFHPGLMTLSITEHQRILDAILSLDETAARAVTHSHIDTLRNDAVSMLSTRAGALLRAG